MNEEGVVHTKTMEELNAIYAEQIRAASVFVKPLTRRDIKECEKCATCGVRNLRCGGEMKLKLCGRCKLVSYCSKECQEQDYPLHKKECGIKLKHLNTVNAKVMSVTRFMKDRYRVFVTSEGKSMATYANVRIPPSPSFQHPKIPISVIRISISNADKTADVEVKALFATVTQASSISQRLATKLGLRSGEAMEVSGLRVMGVKAHMPVTTLEVRCLDTVNTTGEPSAIPRSTPVAFVILPNPGNELVLGKDWLDTVCHQSQRHELSDFAPDMGRLRFLPAGSPSALDQHKAGQLIQRYPTRTIEQGNYIAIPWGRPDPGPNYDSAPEASDFSHHVRPDDAHKAMLQALVDIALTN